MAEISKITSPLIPRENIGNANKPASDQAFEISDPSKVHKAAQESPIQDQRQETQANLGDSISREMLTPFTKPAGELSHAFQKLVTLLQMGISTSEIANNAEIIKLAKSLFMQPEELAQAVREQDASSSLFKGEAFQALRDIMIKFDDVPKVKEALTQLLKTFEQNVNTPSSLKTILHTCNNLLDYMFSKDKAQFSEYLQGLSELMLPADKEAKPAAPPQLPEHRETPPQESRQTPAAANEALLPEKEAAQAKELIREGGVVKDSQVVKEGQVAKEGHQPASPHSTETIGTALQHIKPNPPPPQNGKLELNLGSELGIDQKEAAQILKNNLLPLLGEIVVKYNQNTNIRDMVMVVVHNIVRVDQGTPEALKEAVRDLVSQLKLVANLPADFEKNLTEAILQSSKEVKTMQNSTLSKMTELISKTLSAPSASPASVRQAEQMLMSMLQNQSSVMDLLHFVLPLDTPQGKLFAEMYVDPDNEEKVGRSQDQTRKIFLAFDSESLGNFELCFLASGDKVDFSMWCPQVLVNSLGAIKKQVSNLMQLHGYTMNSYHVEELTKKQSLADLFPKLMDRRLGVDVRI